MKYREQGVSFNINPVRLAIVGAFCTAAVHAPTALAASVLQGTVTEADARDQRAVVVEGATVRIEELDREVDTGRDGKFRFPAVPAGRYTVTVRYLGVETLERSIEVSEDPSQIEDFSFSRDVAELNPTLVVGNAAAVNEALARQRAADNIRTIVNADAIGNFPDANASEALQRLPGLSIERDQGEGRYVRIRGLGPDLNSVTVNGAKVPSPESGSRAVALDVVPTELLESLEVTKSLTPDQDADSLGGTINIKPLSALDRDGLYYRASGFGSYDEHSEETSPKFALSGSNLFKLPNGDKFGVAGGYSYESRDFGSDNAETGGGWEFDDGEALLGEFEQRDYTLTRERTGLTLNLDYLTASGQAFYARYLNTGFEDTEQRLANVFTLLAEDDEGELDDTEVGEGEIAQAAEISREFKKRTETLEVQSLSVGGDNHIGLWNLRYQLAHSEASEDTPFNIDTAAFEGEFEGVGFTSTRQPQPFSDNDLNDASAYELKEIELAETYTEDEDNSAKIDLSREFLLGRHSAVLSFGGKFSQREKTSLESVWVLEDLDDAGFSDEELSLGAFATSAVDYDLGRFGPGISDRALNALVADGRIDLDGAVDEEESILNDYTIQEDIQAGYLMLKVDLDDLRLLGGVRYEGTKYQAEGTSLTPDEDYVPVQVERDYDNWMPSLHARYRLSEDMQLRGAWSNSLVRPGFEDARPGAVDDGEEISLGNPFLEPMKASNIDLGYEWYLGRASALSVYLFYKDIEDFVYVTDLAGVGSYENYDEAEIAQNGEEASVYGFEFSFIKQFSNGFMINANLTLSDSEASIAYADGDGGLAQRDIPLPSQSDTTANFAIGYERARFRVRLAANYKSSYLLEVGDLDDPELDLYQDDQMQIDFTGSVFLTRNLQLQFQGLNLNDEPYYTYTGRGAYNAQYEEYGPTYKIGIVYTNF